MEIGFARANITPSLGVSLSGYGYYRDRKAESVNDALYVSSLVLTSRGETLVIINYDLIGLRVETVRFLKEELREEMGLDSSSILVAATHTHSGPNTCLSEGLGEPCSDEYLSRIVDSALQATRYAWNGRTPITSFKSFIDTSFPGIGFNRVLRQEGPIDNSLRGVFFCREGHRPLALINYACHPVVLGVNKEISGDYPGAVVRAMDYAGFDAVFLNGFCGDIDPLSNKAKWGNGGRDAVREYGQRIASSSIRGLLLNGTEKEFHGVKGISSRVRVPLYQFSEEELLLLLGKAREGLAKGVSSSLSRAQEEWILLLLERLRTDRLEAFEEIEVAAMRIGDIFIVALPGETFTQIGTMIRQAYPMDNIYTVGNANGSIGYIPTDDDIEYKRYAGYGSSWVYNRQPFLPGVAKILGEEAIRLIAELKEESQ